MKCQQNLVASICVHAKTRHTHKPSSACIGGQTVNSIEISSFKPLSPTIDAVMLGTYFALHSTGLVGAIGELLKSS